jgi:dihydrofolate synthase/folylpolyglutamate synthase
MLRSHQATAGALALLEALVEDAARRDIRLGLDEEAIRRGVAAARWPGRLELLRETSIGPVLLDGAHNPAGARALTRALDELGMRRFPLIFGATRGKRVAAVLRALAPLEPRPVFTHVEDDSAIRAEDLLARWRRVTDWGGQTASSPAAALQKAAALRKATDQPIVVAGSLYLVGAVRGILRGEEDA